MQKITVKISSNGQVEYEVSGVKGHGCRELTKAIDEICGNLVLESQNTAEYCQIPDESEREKARGR